ncbi:MAG: hypothetical protein CSA32_01010 [Desulfobulbus propionicus]|nr:MAG: hypothetical protein CSA32_01010 [Desulfobulbus propionicus]
MTCCGCDRINISGKWVYPGSCCGDDILSHGYCPECFAAIMKELTLLSERKALPAATGMQLSVEA